MQQQSETLFQRAQMVIPGGVNSPVRAFKAVGGTPRFISKASGAHLFDADGQQYVDYVGSWGPMILGHAHPAVIQAVSEAMQNGLSFGAPCELEIELAKLICDRMPSIDQIRMVNSGTEATMSAIRLARGYTQRDKFIKFEGCYHGHADSLLVKAGSGALTFGAPSSPGVPENCARDTLLAQYNDLESVERLFAEHGGSIAAIIIEPVPGNMNMLLPKPGFLKGLRELCDHYRSVLIFDEVMTGFRVGPTGVQGLYDVTPDLTTLGKVIGGGMPVGAFGGRREIMQCLSPEGPVYQAGTLSGNPLAMAAGLATLRALSDPTVYPGLQATTDQLVDGLRVRAEAADIPMRIHSLCGMFGLFFTQADDISTYAHVMGCDKSRFNRFFHAMLDAGIYLAPSMFEASFVSTAHNVDDISRTLDAAEKVFCDL